MALAPMVRRTDRHCRVLHRILAPRSWLYTEMVVADSIVFGRATAKLEFSQEEHPIAVQLAGSDPSIMSQAGKLVEARGFDAINLNLGCPAGRATAGEFGACQMKTPTSVARLIETIRGEVSIPVTLKCRTGVDAHDSPRFLEEFVHAVSEAGVDTLIVHARKALLTGFSTRQNRNVPPLDYERVRLLKSRFPSLKVHLNGGIDNCPTVRSALLWADGVMIGRAAYRDPMFMARVHQEVHGQDPGLTVDDVLLRYREYVERELTRGTKLQPMVRHIAGLIRGRPGSARIRRCLGNASRSSAAGLEVIDNVLRMLRLLPDDQLVH